MTVFPGKAIAIYFASYGQVSLTVILWIIYKRPLLRVNISLFKVNNRNTRKRCKICLELTIKPPERRQ